MFWGTTQLPAWHKPATEKHLDPGCIGFGHRVQNPLLGSQREPPPAALKSHSIMSETRLAIPLTPKVDLRDGKSSQSASS